MEQLKAKLKKQGGFTMVELLIVVAIIGILAAVSIPMFNNALEKARHGVDAANIRDAISLGNAEIIASLNPKKDFGPTTVGGAGAKTYSYVVEDDSNDPNEHQAHLEPGTTGGVTAQCTGTNASSAGGLQIKIYYDPTDTGEEFKVMSNWMIDTDGHITTNTAFATFGT